MNTNDLLAAGAAAAAHGQRVPFGMILLAIVVLGALGFGAVRLTQRARLNRPPRPVTKPEPPSPEQAAPIPGPAPARRASVSASLPHPNGRAVETHGLTKRFGPTVAVDDVVGDPELLILDEPMNGLDPAGMHEMRAMIASLADEGRTVVLSSHLLDEVERTCDAVAIVDHGRVIRQGPIDELIRGAGAVVVQVDCAAPARAAQLIDEAGIAAGTALTDTGLAVTLPAGASREAVADVNRRLVAAGIDVYGLREVQTSLEDWFLSVTSRLGEPS